MGRVYAYQVYVVGANGKPLAVAAADTASSALSALREIQKDTPRAWVLNSDDFDINIWELERRAEEEQSGA